MDIIDTHEEVGRKLVNLFNLQMAGTIASGKTYNTGHGIKSLIGIGASVEQDLDLNDLELMLKHKLKEKIIYCLIDKSILRAFKEASIDTSCIDTYGKRYTWKESVLLQYEVHELKKIRLLLMNNLKSRK